MEYRNKVFGSDEFKDIQKEIIDMEESETVFMMRMGDNVTSEDGGGNTRYNKDTKQIDLNISERGEFTEMQKVAHEMKHGSQFLEGKIGFKYDGTPDGILNDYQDEAEAYKRGNRFSGRNGKFLSDEDIYNRIRSGAYKYDYSLKNTTLRTIPENSLKDMIKTNNGYMERDGHPKYIYDKWADDIEN
ncbi:MAG: hypothetical protein JEZ03_06540 [Bacteroidales bacterium]|nr:hypothetical protein [Bacteroidales bacterium]